MKMFVPRWAAALLPFVGAAVIAASAPETPSKEKKISPPQPELDAAPAEAAEPDAAVTRSSAAVAEPDATEAEVTPLPWPTATPNAAGFALFSILTQNREFLPDDGNLVLSPANLEPVLQALRLGADGKTAEELDRVLGSAEGSGAALDASAPPPSAELREGMGLWVADGWPLKPDFAAGLEQGTGTEPQSMDFAEDPGAATEEINAWVREATERKIEQLFEPADLDATTRLVIASALAYEGRWDLPFDKKYTQPGEFQMGKGKTAPADFMHQVGELGWAEQEDGTRVVTLPLQDGRQRCVLILPPVGGDRLRSLTGLEKKLTPDLYRTLVGSAAPATVDLKLPRLGVKVRSSIKAGLQLLGAGSMFSARTADFSRMSEERGLCVSVLRHEVVFELDEEGARGSAATGAAMATRGWPGKPKVIAFDRPFLYAIEEVATGRVLFLGRMVRPVEAAAREGE